MPHPKSPAALAGLLLGLGTAALAQVAAAQGAPRSVGECERLKNDLAYNQCLAMFGPAAKNVAGGYAAGEVPPVPATAAAATPQAEEPAEEARGSRRGRYRVRRGRQSAVFTAGSGEVRSYRRRR